jgi:hypothetical protein
MSPVSNCSHVFRNETVERSKCANWTKTGTDLYMSEHISVSLQRRGCSQLLLITTAQIWPYTGTQPFMFLKVTNFPVCILTSTELISVFICMHKSVSFQTSSCSKWLLTNLTQIGMFTCMHTFMSLKMINCSKWLLTNLTRVWMFTCMHMFMGLKMMKHSEWLFTNTTCIWTFTSMQAFMSLQIIPSKWLLANITRIHFQVRNI